MNKEYDINYIPYLKEEIVILDYYLDCVDRDMKIRIISPTFDYKGKLSDPEFEDIAIDLSQFRVYNINVDAAGYVVFDLGYKFKDKFFPED